MAAFHYNALDAEGKASNGMIEADSARLARTQLREGGLFVVELNSLSDTQAQGGGSRSFNLPFRKRIPLAEVSLMLRQLATLLEAGLPLEQALAVLIEQGDNPVMRQVIAAMRSEVLAGNTLARAMAIILPTDTIGQTWFPYAVARLRQSWGSYDQALMVVFAMAAIGAIAIALLPKDGSKDEPQPVTGALGANA